MEFTDHFVAVTGAGSGIGRATALRFAQDGATVAVVGHSSANAEEVADQIRQGGGAADPFAAELSRPESVAALFATIAERYPRLDAVVANAGVNGVWAPVDVLDVDDWQHTIATNLTGSFATIKYALPLLRAAGGGSVVLTSSINGTRVFATPGGTAYGVSKAGQVALAKMCAVELAADRIRVNVVCPGAIDTEIGDNTEQRQTDELRARGYSPEGKIPLSADLPGAAAQVAELICFLSSDRADHISGTEVWIDGAQSLVG